MLKNLLKSLKKYNTFLGPQPTTTNTLSGGLRFKLKKVKKPNREIRNLYLDFFCRIIKVITPKEITIFYNLNNSMFLKTKKKFRVIFLNINRNFSSKTNESFFLTDSDKHEICEIDKILISLEKTLLCKLNLLERGHKDYKKDLELILSNNENKIIETTLYGHIGFDYTQISLELKYKAFLKTLDSLEIGQKLILVNSFDEDNDALNFFDYTRFNLLSENCDVNKHLKIDYDILKNKRMFSEDELLKNACLIAEFREILMDLLIDIALILQKILDVKKK